jgi:SAM-dependent methyltransferase
MNFLRDLVAGNSLFRSQGNRVMRRWRLDMHGTIVDLASGGPGYQQFWEPKPSERWVSVDIRDITRPSIIANLKCDLPMRDSYADVVLITGFIHITRTPVNLLREARRILKPGGSLVMKAPMAFNYSPEPTDYWRFTREGVRALLTEAGFVDLEIVDVGGRWSSASHLLGPYIHPRRVLAPIVYLICDVLDRFASRYLRRWTRPSPSGFCARARAPLVDVVGSPSVPSTSLPESPPVNLDA